MRDLFEELFVREPLDPIEAVRRNMRPRLRKRFYQAATVEPVAEGFRILLDGKPIRTPGRRLLAAPSKQLAEAIAAEWEAQREVVDPAQMPLTRLANAIIDGVADAPQPVADEIAKYLGSDLVCYRAEGPAALVERHAAAWDPVLAWASDALGARFVVGSGVRFLAQPEGAVAAARAAIPLEPWTLGALASVTSLTGSALLALALLNGRLTVEQAWQAAHIDEDWNMEQWGRDDQELARRAAREGEMKAAATVLSLLSR